MWKLIVLLFSSISICSAALLACAAGVTCPSGGIWSEWSTTGTCTTSCGSCSKLYYTRKCLSTSANCTCSGNSSFYLLCNTKTCLSPAQRTCCIPYLPMLINGSMHCGPIPKDTSSSTTSCCPVNGLWSEWSAYSRDDNDTAWIKTRSCVSESAGCPCTGSSVMTSSTCPCRAMVDVANAVRGSYYVYPINATINQCTYTGYLQTREDATNYPCRGSGVLVRYMSPDDSGRKEFRVLACNAPDMQPNNNKVTFHCDLESLYWQLDYNNDLVTGWVQINIFTG